MKVKVTVDYTNGCYNVTGFHEKEGKNHSLYKDITSYSYYSGIVYEKNYNKIAIEERKRKIRREINKIKNQDPSFKFSKNALSEVDTLLYEALKDWDNLLGNHTNYATDFLKIIMKDYTPTERESHAKILSRKSRKQCMIERADALKKAGIDITYNVGIFNTSKKLSLSDKIKGIMLAKKQKRFIGAKVINNISKRIYF